jgi:hypothetical protein
MFWSLPSLVAGFLVDIGYSYHKFADGNKIVLYPGFGAGLPSVVIIARSLRTHSV